MPIQMHQTTVLQFHGIILVANTILQISYQFSLVLSNFDMVTKVQLVPLVLWGLIWWLDYGCILCATGYTIFANIVTVFTISGIALASITGVPPVYGLYTAIFPCFLYIFFGTSKHNALGKHTSLKILIN